MGFVMTADISRMLEVGQREIFTKNFEAYPAEYPSYCVDKPSSKDTETYDSMGNIANGGELIEGDSITYNKAGQAYQTSISTKMWANGYSYSYKSKKLDLYGVVNSMQAKELARTFSEDLETEAIYWIDNCTTVTLADGVALISATHPLVNSAAVVDNTQTAGSISNPANHKAMINAFRRGWKNHAGGKMKINPTDALTSSVNQMDVEAVYESMNKPLEVSNTKNTLPRNVNWHYSSFMSSETAWLMWDKSFENPVIRQVVQEPEFAMDEDTINTKNLYFNYIALMNWGCKPAMGCFYNAGA